MPAAKYSVPSVRPFELAKILNVEASYLHHTLDTNNVPRNPDKTYDLRVVVPWWIDYRTKIDAKKSLNLEKVRADIEYKKSQTAKNLSRYVLKSDHLSVLNVRAESLRNHLEAFCSKKYTTLLNLNKKELKDALFLFVKSAMSEYIDAASALATEKELEQIRAAELKLNEPLTEGGGDKAESEAGCFDTAKTQGKKTSNYSHLSEEDLL